MIGLENIAISVLGFGGVKELVIGKFVFVF